jgi:acyl-CoA dehydrogenase
MSKLSASEVAVRTTERAIHTMGRWGYITDHSVEKWYRDAKLHTIFEGTSEIQRVVISNALGTADGKPPLHVDLEPSGGPLNRMFGRGTPARTQVANSALAMRDRIPQPVMQLAISCSGRPGSSVAPWASG